MPVPNRYRALRSFALRLPVAFLAAVAVWLVLLPIYGRAVARAGVGMAHMVESPNLTRWQIGGARVAKGAPDDGNVLYFWPEGMARSSATPNVPLAEITFTLVILLALYFATPGLLAGKGWSGLAISVLILAVVHALEVFFRIESTFALRMGAWSAARYSEVARNFYGWGKHFVDLSLKFAVPFALWAYFNWKVVRGRS